MLIDNDRPGLDEQYIVATNTSDLTLRPDQTCAATHLIAAGLVGNRMGEALTHLRSEWASAEKPRKATETEITFRAELFLAILGQGNRGKPDVKRVRTEALIGYAVALRQCAYQLRGWPLAIALLREWGIGRAEPALLPLALYHWLNPTCPVCDGHGKRKLPDAPVLGKACHHCAGTGKWPRPLGSHDVHDWLQRCVATARADRGALVRGAPIFGDR